MIDPEKWNDIKENMPVEPYVDNEEDFVLLIQEIESLTTEVGRVSRANAVYLDAFSQEKIEKLEAERDELIREGDELAIIADEKAAEIQKKLDACEKAFKEKKCGHIGT